MTDTSSRKIIDQIFNDYIKNEVLPNYTEATAEELEKILDLCMILSNAYYSMAKETKELFGDSFILLFFNMLEKTAKKINQEILKYQQEYESLDKTFEKSYSNKIH